MSDKFNNSELLVELSTEEQQLIAGGQYFATGFPISLGTSFTRFYGIQTGGLGTLGGFGGYGGLGMYGGSLGMYGGGFGMYGGVGGLGINNGYLF